MPRLNPNCTHKAETVSEQWPALCRCQTSSVRKQTGRWQTRRASRQRKPGWWCGVESLDENLYVALAFRCPECSCRPQQMVSLDSAACRCRGKLRSTSENYHKDVRHRQRPEIDGVESGRTCCDGTAKAITIFPNRLCSASAPLYSNARRIWFRSAEEW